FCYRTMDGIIMMLPAPLQKLSTHHDYPGQRKAERIFQVILVVSGIIGFGVGFQTQQLSHAIFTVLGGAVLSALIVLPPWPCFRRHPINWQPVQEKTECGAAEEMKEEMKEKKEAKKEKKEEKREKKEDKKEEKKPEKKKAKKAE
ncbi:hypothetical protein PENTCL1PPCAC_24538, partial [Pristionchus entomophagus]